MITLTLTPDEATFLRTLLRECVGGNGGLRTTSDTIHAKLVEAGVETRDLGRVLCHQPTVSGVPAWLEFVAEGTPSIHEGMATMNADLNAFDKLAVDTWAPSPRA
jgi:hypothetical protein